MRINMRLVCLLMLCILASATEEARAQTSTQGKTQTYSNSREGVFFRYPAGFMLKEGDLANTDDIGFGYMGPLRTAFVQDGGVRIATVEIPATFYPKTDFVNAFFSVSVHEHMTAAECKQFRSEQESPKTKRLKAGGLTFTGIEEDSAAMNHQLGASYFHTYVRERCYEASFGLATAGYGVIDGITHVHDKAIVASLQAVARTLRVTAPSPR
jgi:hypothetical protein